MKPATSQELERFLFEESTCGSLPVHEDVAEDICVCQRCGRYYQYSGLQAAKHGASAALAYCWECIRR